MTDPNHIAEARKKIGRPQIREVFLRNGAHIEPGHDDLPDYVYESVFELLEMAAPAVQGEPVEYQCHSCRKTTPPPAPFKAYVECGECGALTAAPIAVRLAAPQPAEQQPCPEGVREGAPYDDPAFESLCRDYGIWGTAAAAQCAVFWGAGKRAAEQKPAPDVADYEKVLDDHGRLTRELDVLLNGEEGAAKQASLCDLLGQLRSVVGRTGKPVLTAPDVSGLVEALEFIAKSVHPQVNGTGVVFRDVDGRDWRNWLETAEQLLAAHRKGEKI